MLISFEEVIDLAINRKVHFIRKQLEVSFMPGMEYVTPAYQSLLVKYKPALTSFDTIKDRVEQILEDYTAGDQSPSIIKEIPVCYDPEFGLDLEEISKARKIDVAEIISIHLSRTYTVFMLGFQPGFPYMGILDERLEMPRRKRPRPRIEAGSVAIAGKQTAIYPGNSPGGWQIIGRSPIALMKDGISFLQPGDEVIFMQIDRTTFDNWKNEAVV